MSFKTNNTYLNLTANRILLLVIGLWPYQQSNLIRFQFICLSSIMTASFIFQCTVFISQKCTPDLLIKALSSIFFFAFCMTKYNLFSLNLEFMKDMLEQLLYACNDLKDANEIAIIDEYGCHSKRCTIVLTILVIFCLLAFTVLSLWSDISNVILLTNSSRSQLLSVEYFINQEKYFYLISLHSIVSICIALTAMLAIGTMFYTYFHLTCGVFKIASYRLEHAMSINMPQNINLSKNIVIFNRLICAVDSHRQAMKLIILFQTNFETMLFFLIIFGVMAVSLNMFGIASSEEDVKEFLKHLLNTAILFVYMFLSNYCGQNVIDHSHQIFATAYNIQWYLAQIYIQKIILFLLQRGSKSFSFTIGGIYDSSIEGFATLAKASVSYFTVIYSTR